MSGASVPSGYEVRFFPYHAKLDRCALLFAESDADAVSQSEMLRDWRAMELWRDTILVGAWPPAKGKMYQQIEMTGAVSKKASAHQISSNGVEPRSDL